MSTTPYRLERGKDYDGPDVCSVCGGWKRTGFRHRSYHGRFVCSVCARYIAEAVSQEAPA